MIVSTATDKDIAQTESGRVALAKLNDTSPYVEWSSVAGGAVVALALIVTLLTFGASAGLSAVSPWNSTRSGLATVSIGAGFWMVLVYIWAFGLGGYLSGRTRHRREGAAQEEVEFRDGAHGLIVWGVAVSVVAIVATLLTAAVSSDRGSRDTSSLSPLTAATDTLLRSAKGSALPDENLRAQVMRVLPGMLVNPVPAENRAYLVDIVATRSTPADAERRVDAAIAQLKESANRARKTAIVLGFMTAASLLLGAAMAWWAASIGGQHRDAGTVWEGLSAGRRPVKFSTRH